MRRWYRDWEEGWKESGLYRRAVGHFTGGIIGIIAALGLLDWAWHWTANIHF